jgi:hypothetical protein
MKTAVEWLYETLWKQNNYSLPSNILEQAKEMEKEQMVQSYANGEADAIKTFEQQEQ